MSYYLLWFSGLTQLSWVVLVRALPRCFSQMLSGASPLGPHWARHPGWPLTMLAVGAGWHWELGCQRDWLLSHGGWVPGECPKRSKWKLQVYFMTLPQKPRSVTSAAF